MIPFFPFVFFLSISFVFAGEPPLKEKSAVKVVSNSQGSSQSSLKKSADGSADQENFQPSLSETINNTNQLKKRIKRQLAREWESGKEERNPQSDEESFGESAIAHFGDLEVSISKGDDEELEIVEDEEADSFF